jgi:hypothetical protein
MSERSYSCFDKGRIFIQNLIFIQLYRRKKILKAIFGGLKYVFFFRRPLMRGNEKERNFPTHS